MYYTCELPIKCPIKWGHLSFFLGQLTTFIKFQTCINYNLSFSFHLYPLSMLICTIYISKTTYLSRLYRHCCISLGWFHLSCSLSLLWSSSVMLQVLLLFVPQVPIPRQPYMIYEFNKNCFDYCSTIPPFRFSCYSPPYTFNISVVDPYLQPIQYPSQAFLWKFTLKKQAINTFWVASTQ